MAFLCLPLFALNGFAQDSGKEVDLSPLEITEKQIPVYGQFAVPESSKTSVETITSREIERINPENFYDLVSRGAGIEYNYQGRRQFDFTYLRGESVGLIIDGVVITPHIQRRILSSFPMEAIESIRIVKDATTLAIGPVKQIGSYNSAPIGGYIVITTKKAYRGQIGGSMSYGNFGTMENQIYFADKIGDFSFRLTGTHKNSDGKDDWYMDQSSRSFLFSAAYSNSFIQSNLMMFMSDGHRNMQLFDSVVAANFVGTNIMHWGYDPMQTYQIGLDTSFLWSPSQITSIAVGYGYFKATFHGKTYNSTDSPAMRGPNVYISPNSERITEETVSRDKSATVKLWHTAVFGGNTLRAGVQFVDFRVPATRNLITGSSSNDGVHEAMYSVYVQDEQRLLDDKLTLDGGVRADFMDIVRGNDEYAASGAGGTYLTKIKDKWTKPTVGVSLGASYKILDELLAASARFGYNLTSISSYCLTVNDKDLDPENRFKYELGISSSLSSFFNIRLTGFVHQMDNAFVTVRTVTLDDGSDADVYDNGGRERLYGFEITADGELPLGFNYRGNYSRSTHSDDVTNSSSPRHTAALRLGWSLWGIEVNGSMQYIGPYNSSSAYPCGDFVRFDGNIGYRYSWTDAVSSGVRAYCRNMTGKHYNTNNRGFSNPGRSYGIQVSVDAGF